LKATVASGAKAGDMLEITLEDASPLPEGTFRVVHLEFRTPSGKQYELYDRNALVKTTPHMERVPFAVNDPKGNWKMTAYDLMTGQIIETSFDLA
jgi:uncharacterized circularly permuted ATP-grasp superfamily protein